MTILLTGATGYIGSSVLRRLLETGHEVTALVRSEEKAATLRETGATVVVGDATDLRLLRDLVRSSEGVIHTAATGDSSSATLDSALIAIVRDEFASTDRPFVHTGGIWVYGAGEELTESSRQRPDTISGWRIPIEAEVRAAEVRTTIVAPGIVYGLGGGIPADFVSGDEVRLAGDGTQRWAVVHVDDLADLYVLAFDAAGDDDYIFAVSEEEASVRDLAEAAAHGRPIIDETPDETRARLGQAYADALLTDQVASSAHARSSLGWSPSRPSLVDDLRDGSYAKPGQV